MKVLSAADNAAFEPLRCITLGYCQQGYLKVVGSLESLNKRVRVAGVYCMHFFFFK